MVQLSTELIMTVVMNQEIVGGQPLKSRATIEEAGGEINNKRGMRYNETQAY